MNNGKICISICAESAADLADKIASAEPLADMLEIRYDCLEPAEIESVDRWLSENSLTGKTITTFRPFEQGGHRDTGSNGHERRAELQQKTGGEDRRTNEKLPVHFQTIALS